MMPVWIKERAKSLKTNLKKNTYKGDNRYLSFHERLCRFNQNKINRIIESASDELIISLLFKKCTNVAGK